MFLELVMVETSMSNAASTIRTRTRRVALRVPIAPAQRQAAIAAYNHYTKAMRTGEISSHHPARIVTRLALMLGLICLPLGALGFWMNANAIMQDSLTPPLLAMIGTLGGIGALVVGGVSWLVMLRRRP